MKNMAFRASLDAERARPDVMTEAWLLFPWYIVELRKLELYPRQATLLCDC